MTKISNWVTAKEFSGTVNIAKHISEDESSVGEKAKSLETEIVTLYRNIEKNLSNIGSEFKSMKKDSFRGFDKRIERQANKFSNRATYTKQRRKQLEQLFTYATLENKVNELEASLNKLQAGDSVQSTGDSGQSN